MRRIGRLLSSPKTPVLKPAKIDPLRLFHRLGNTTVRGDDFQIVLEGEWNRTENPQRIELLDATGTQQLFISKWVHDARDFKQIQRAVAHFAELKHKGLEELGEQVQILKVDGRIDGQQVESRLEAHDAKAQVAIATLIRADRSVLLELTTYQHEVPAPDKKVRAEAQAMFDLLRLHDPGEQ
jgi:ABC-type phosphate transport system auxiliary subunit